MDEMFAEGAFQPSFRIFMSASPVPGFPISLLQRSIKMATEPQNPHVELSLTSSETD